MGNQHKRLITHNNNCNLVFNKIKKYTEILKKIKAKPLEPVVTVIFYRIVKGCCCLLYSILTLFHSCFLSQKPSDLSRSKTFSTLSDILKRVNSRRSSLGQTRTENPTPGISKSTLELNAHRSDTASNARTTVREIEISHLYAVYMAAVGTKR